MTTDFESLHPRQQSGKFAAKSNSAPAGGLAAPDSDEQIKARWAAQEAVHAHVDATFRPERPPQHRAGQKWPEADSEYAEQIRLEMERRGLTGAGPAAPQSPLERHLAGEDRMRDRPLRDHLPLQPEDDDEFFDAPGGTIIEIDAPDGKRWYRKSPGPHAQHAWLQIDENGERAARFTTESGKVWAEVFGGDAEASLFGDESKMLPATLRFPAGVTFSDRTYYVDERH